MNGSEKYDNIGSDNGLLPDRHQAIIWTSAGILSIGPWGTNFSQISIKIKSYSLKRLHCKMLSAKCWPFNCLCLYHKRMVGPYMMSLCNYVTRFRGILTAILTASANVSHSHWKPAKIERKHVYFSVSTVPADDLAPLGARAFAGAVMTQFGSWVYKGLALQGLSSMFYRMRLLQYNQLYM